MAKQGLYYRPSADNEELIKRIERVKGVSRNVAMDLLVTLAREYMPADLSDTQIETHFILSREDHLRAQSDMWPVKDGDA